MSRQLLCKTATALILGHGFTTFAPAADESVLGVRDDFTASPRLERADPTSPTSKRVATAAEIAAYDAAQLDATAQEDISVAKAVKAVLIYLAQRMNEVRTQPTTAFPALTQADVVNGVTTIY